MFFLDCEKDVPEFFGKFKGDIFTVMEFFVKFSFEFLVDAFIFFIGHEVGLKLEEGDSSKEPQLTGPKKFEEGAEHIPFVMNKRILNYRKR